MQSQKQCQTFPLSELIDTLWNVNHCHGRRSGHGHSELIDTLWNVNEDGHDHMVNSVQN